MSSEIVAPPRRAWEEPALTRHTFGTINKFSGIAINTRAPLVPTTVVDEIDGCAVSELLRHFGSPLFVVSESRLRREFRDFQAAFRAGYPNTQVAYSYKTNYLTGIRSLLHEEGAWAEVVSGLEYEMARRLEIRGRASSSTARGRPTPILGGRVPTGPGPTVAGSTGRYTN